jgi:hypothetical protein
MITAEGLLTAEGLRAVLSYHPAGGVFTWLVKPSRRVRAGAVAGCIYRGYRRIKVGSRLYPAHRLAWLWMTGAWPAAEIDHINMDRDDNRWCNLREASHSQNQANSCLPTNSRSGFKGVSWHNRDHKWASRIQVNGKRKNLGYFDTPERAFIEYMMAAWRHFGDFANIDADYIKAIRKRKFERSVLWNLANPDPDYMAA